MIKIKRKTIVRIDDIRQATYDAYLDTEYREALTNALITLGYIEDRIEYVPFNRYTLINKQQLIDKVTNRELNGNEISEIIHLMMYKLRNDFQYGRFKPIVMRYLDISQKMLQDEAEINKSDIKEKPRCNIYNAFGGMFEIIGLTSKTLKENKMFDKSREMIERATMAYDYDEAFNIINEYVDTYEKSRGQEEEEEFE